MTKERIYHLLYHFYNLLVNDFPRNGLITKGIYEVEQVYQALEAIPQSQEYLIRCEIQQFLKELEQVQTGYQIRFNKDEVLVLDDLKQEIACK